MRNRIAIVALALLLPGVLAEENYTYSAPDAAADFQPHCHPATAAPSTDNPCDILAFEAGHDDDLLYLKTRLAAVSWPNAAEGVNVRITFSDPAGTTWIIDAILGGNGGVSPGNFASGNRPAGLQWSVIASEKAVRATIPMASMGGTVPGGQFEFDAVVTRIGSPQGGQFLTAVMDSVPNLGVLTIAGDPVGAGAEPTTYFVDLVRANVTQNFTIPTMDTYVYNFTVETPGLLMESDIAVATGTVHVVVTDANGTIVHNATLDDSTGGLHSGDLIIDEAAQGPWNLTLRYDDFTGNVTFGFTGLTYDDAGPAGPDSSETGAADGNATAGPGKAEDTPGPPFVALISALAMAVYRRCASARPVGRGDGLRVALGGGASSLKP